MISVLIRSYQRLGLNRFHPYHMVKPSMWPFLTSFSLMFLVISMISTFYETSTLSLVLHVGPFNLFMVISLIFLFVNMFGWWSDVSIESGEHTSFTVRGLKMGMILFIVSEVLFFFSFFWALFHVSLSPDIQIGGIWPPVGFESIVLDFKKVPLLNTVLLLSSGVTVTYAHLAFFVNFKYTGPFVYSVSKAYNDVYNFAYPPLNMYGETFVPAPYEVLEDGTRVFNVNSREYMAPDAVLKREWLDPSFPSFLKNDVDTLVFNNLKNPREFRKVFFTDKNDKHVVNDMSLLKTQGGFGVGVELRKYIIQHRVQLILALDALLRGFWAMFLTIAFAVMFLLLQMMEYFEAFFSISDSVYGSTFFVMTGFHGLHVLVGTIFLIVSTIRIAGGNFFGRHSTGLECAIWYWHFVDVVWLFLYISIYYWGNIIIADLNYDLYFNGNITDVRSDYAEEEAIFFQDPATGFMEKIIELHNYIMQILIVVGFIITFILYEIVYRR